jgi:RHS repeat-associated protein
VTEKIGTQTIITTTDYLNGYQYVNNILQFFPHSEGYVKVTGTSYNYVYNYTDHLGNIRLSYSKDPATNALKVIEENHYYPFGLKHTGYNSDKYYIAPNPVIKWPNKGDYVDTIIIPYNPATFNASLNYDYKFENKEWQDELSLNLYDFGLRQYDPAIGRWTSMDPVTHFEQSPYVAFDNNPVFWTDPDGADTRDPIKDKVTLISSYVDKSNVTHITQTTTNTTTTFNDDGSVKISYSSSSVTNTVDADGNVTKGSTVTQSSGSISKDSEGKVSSKAGKTTTRNATSSDATSALNQWTNAVSSYNKTEGNGVFNVDKIDKTANYTNKAGKTGIAVLGSFAGFNSLFSKLNSNTKSVVGLVGGSTSADGLIGLAGDALKNHIGKNNSYAILYGVQHVQNGGLMKEMKTPAGQAGGSRYSVGPTSWQGLWKTIKSWFN